jgi:hypothetical protein
VGYTEEKVVQNILRELAVSYRTQATVWAVRKGRVSVSIASSVAISSNESLGQQRTFAGGPRYRLDHPGRRAPVLGGGGKAAG